MAERALQNASASGYLAAVARADEMARLQAQAQKRKSMLVFGPAGVGKTRLLEAFAKTYPLALYVSRTNTPRDLLLALFGNLRNTGKRELRLPVSPDSLSASSLKGVVQSALDRLPFLLVLDHLAGPSSVVTRIIKEMNYYGRTPVIFAARTPHMEDIGTLRPMCADRSERIEMKNFASQVALEFARREAEESRLWASNLEPAIHSFVEWSDGNPGAIIQMVKMAHLPKYRLRDQIKAHVLYLDHLMGRHQ